MPFCASLAYSYAFWRVEKTWRDLAYGPFVAVSSSVDRDPCGLSNYGSNKFQS